MVNTVRVKDITARERAVVSENIGREANTVKASACWVWKAKHNSASNTFKIYSYIDVNPQQKEYKEKEVIDSGCSRHMTGNKCYLTDYEDYDGGFISFGDGKGRIFGKVLLGNGVAERKNKILIEATRTMALVIKPHNKTPYEFIRGRPPLTDFIKPFGCPVTILNTRDSLGKFDEKADEGFFVGYYMISKAMRVFNKRTMIVKETLNIRFLENAPNMKGNGPDWLFDIFSLTISMNYEPVFAGKQTNGIAGTKDNIVAGPKDRTIDAAKKDTKVDKSRVLDNGGQGDQVTRIQKLRRTNHKDFQNCSFSCYLSQMELKKPVQALKDPSWMKVMQDELLQFKLLKVWTLVDLPKDKSEIGTKWVFRNKNDERGIVSGFLYGKIEEQVYVCQPPGFEDPDFPDKVYKIEKALYGLHQAPRAWYETLSTYLIDNGFYRGQIDKTLFIKRHKDDILLVQVYVDDIIFGSTKKELKKPTESDGFEQIDDFLNANPIKYALTLSPTIYTSCIKQFWTSTKVKIVNDDVRLQSLAYGKKIIVNEASIRRDLRLDDAEGTACLPNDAIFEGLARMGVLSLEQTKTNQASKIEKLNKRVKKLEGKKKKRTHGLKRLYKVGLSARVESFEDEEDLGAQEDASKQGRIADIDANDDLFLIDETAQD
nr:hypothetical protein [Tanacetum cinerariifolium]